ncbi:unnamed protein product [Dicrocoelium dendriticum]|nr:unnamed protein product [Dicrocoelium dendriticum]
MTALITRLFPFLFIYFGPTLAFPKRVTFELLDGQSRCFHEALSPKKYVFMYQVIYGGQADVDISVKDSRKRVISQAERATHDEVVFALDHNDTYSFCFDNSFSPMSHKLIYFELRPESFESLAEEAGGMHPLAPLTFIENEVELVHLFLSRAESLQVELKNRELGDRLVAEELNTAVLMWSSVVTVVIVVTTLGQVAILKNFFSDKKSFPHRMPHS